MKKKIFFGGGRFFFSEKPFFLGLKFERNLSVNTVRSGTDYCWLYCAFYNPESEIWAGVQKIKIKNQIVKKCLFMLINTHLIPRSVVTISKIILMLIY